MSAYSLLHPWNRTAEVAEHTFTLISKYPE